MVCPRPKRLDLPKRGVISISSSQVAESLKVKERAKVEATQKPHLWYPSRQPRCVHRQKLRRIRVVKCPRQARKVAFRWPKIITSRSDRWRCSAKMAKRCWNLQVWSHQSLTHSTVGQSSKIWKCWELLRWTRSLAFHKVLNLWIQAFPKVSLNTI